MSTLNKLLKLVWLVVSTFAKGYFWMFVSATPVAVVYGILSKLL